MIVRTFAENELNLVRRSFEVGKPDPEMLADEDFMFDEPTHRLASVCLESAKPGQPVHFTAEAWSCLGICCAVGARTGVVDEDYTTMLSLTGWADGDPDAPQTVGFV